MPNMFISSFLTKMEIPIFSISQKTPRVAILVTIALLLFTVSPAFYSLLSYPIFLLKTSPVYDRFVSTLPDDAKCDIFSGEWVPDTDAPYYNNTTCYAIHDHQNCMKFGRPDTEFMKWRWKPDGCELPVFDPEEFLEIVRGKSMAFVGDSISRNQVQSLVCLLSKVEYPIDISPTANVDYKKWKYPTYNFTIQALWTPFLVKSSTDNRTGPVNPSTVFDLYLDEFNLEWTAKIDRLDYLVISTGHWFFRPLIFHENNQIVGCQYCGLPNVTDFPMYQGYRKALRTSFRAILENFKGIAFLRTFTPAHFEGGEWNNGGNCVRTTPFGRNESVIQGLNLDIREIQIEEFRVAEEEGRKKGVKIRLIDAMPAMLMRPDGHPGRYGHLPDARVDLVNDCIHWCLPGPIDTLNGFLLELLKTEEHKKKNMN